MLINCTFNNFINKASPFQNTFEINYFTRFTLMARKREEKKKGK